MNSLIKLLKQSSTAKKLRKLQIELVIKWNKRKGNEIVHFFHIGKTGGTAIQNALSRKKLTFGKGYVLVFESHGFYLKDLPKDHYVFFVVRDPISRYVSGFYSRYRMGMPAIYNPWKNGEEEAFTEFPTPNDLGEALSSDTPEVRERAKKALSSIGHVKTSYYQWFHSPEALKDNIHRIKFVAVQENLNNDFDQLKKFFGLDETIMLPVDKEKSHKNPDSFNKKLSDTAIINLKKHYEKEYEFLDILYDEGLITKKYS